MTRHWPEIRTTYEEWVAGGLNLQSMVRLVGQIESSRLRDLFAWTSMHDLCIVQTAVVYPYDGPYLRISPRFDGTLEFRYQDTYRKDHQWHRVVPEEQAFERLLRFTDELCWYPRRIEPPHSETL